MKAEKSSEGIQRKLTMIFLVYLLVVFIGFIATWQGITHQNILWEKIGNSAITATVGIANIIMVYFIAQQAIANSEMVKQMVKEATIMNENLIEMRKQRLNIEEFKNSLIGYLEYLRHRLRMSEYVALEPYPYLLREYRERIESNPSPAETGFIWRVSRFIEKFLEKHGFSMQDLREHNEFINKARDDRTSSQEKSELMEKSREKSQELLKIVNSVFGEVTSMSDTELEMEILQILEFKP